MRYTPKHKADSRKRILRAAGARFREDGIKGASIPRIMEEAGMTVGGFYKHFTSKQELLQSMLGQSLSRMLELMRALPARGNAWRESTAAVYLSRAHCKNTRDGCPLPSLAADIARTDDETRVAFGKGIEEMAETMAECLSRDDPAEAREEAWAMLATLVGGMTLARAVKDDAQAAEILRACRHAVSEARSSPSKRRERRRSENHSITFRHFSANTTMKIFIPKGLQLHYFSILGPGISCPFWCSVTFVHGPSSGNSKTSCASTTRRCHFTLLSG